MLYMFVAIGFIRILLQRVKDLQADVFFLFYFFCFLQTAGNTKTMVCSGVLIEKVRAF